MGRIVNTAEIICVGTELLTGKTLNTNAYFLSRQLNSLGINCYHQIVVGDNFARLEKAIKQAFDRADCVILTGGLGPTEDDITMSVVAHVTDKPLEYHEELAARLEEYFAKINKPITKNNYKQAYMPQSADFVPNNNGTATGAIVSFADDKVAIVLPGPPDELQPMFTDTVRPWLLEHREENTRFNMHYIKFAGIGESKVADVLSDLIEGQEEVTIATYVDGPEVAVRIGELVRDGVSSPKFRDIVTEIRKRLGQYIFTEDMRSLSEVVASKLAESGMTIAFAESCTAGMACSTLADNPGSSAYLLGGIISYDNRIKREELAVEEKVLSEYGAVSEQCAHQMVTGVRQKFNSDLAVAITGIAGPEGGSAEKPVGTVYIAVASEKDCYIKRYNFTGNRQKVRHDATFYALHSVWKMFSNLDTFRPV